MPHFFPIGAHRPDWQNLRLILLLGSTQMLGWGSSYYLPAVLASPIAKTTGITPMWVQGAFSLALIIAGLAGPATGRFIDRLGGRSLLLASSSLFAISLCLLGMARGPVLLCLAWAGIGLAMGTGLYEAAFATLVRLKGRDAGGMIAGVSLLGGLASSVSWPLTSLLIEELGWSGACYVWAGLHICIGVPCHALLPKATPRPAPCPCPTENTKEDNRLPTGFYLIAGMLALAFSLNSFTSTAMAAHMPVVLQLFGVSVAASIGLAALTGPALIFGRVLQITALRRVSALLCGIPAAFSHAFGVTILAYAGASGAIPFVWLNGYGNGAMTIVKGLLPLEIFGEQGYGKRQGWLTMPGRILHAFAPLVFALALENGVAVGLWLSGGLSVLGGFLFVALALLTAKSRAISKK